MRPSLAMGLRWMRERWTAMPVRIAVGALSAACLSVIISWGLERVPGLDFARRIEFMTYDARMKFSARRAPSPASQLGGVFIDDRSMNELNRGAYGERFSWPWPRSVYGRIVRELKAQGARAVGFDILFDELRRQDPVYRPAGPGSEPVGADEYFAQEITKAGNVILAAEAVGQVMPVDLFRTNAAALGSIVAARDADNVVRRARAYFDYIEWHPEVKDLARAMPLDLKTAQFLPGKIVVRIPHSEAVHEIELNADGSLNAEPFQFPPGTPPQMPFVRRRLWHMGIRLGAVVLGLDLDRAIVRGGRIELRSESGRKREIPIDEAGFFLIDWVIRWGDARLPVHRLQSAGRILSADATRHADEAGAQWVTNAMRDAVVIVGSVATANNVRDEGATPLESSAMLVVTHLNVANMILGNRFIRATGRGNELVLVLAFGAFTCWAASRTRVLSGVALAAAAGVAYVAASTVVFSEFRWWLPIFMPMAAGVALPLGTMITWRVLFEQRERQRVRSIFARVVAPDVVAELLKSERLTLGGARRRVTVFFADVRGFTRMTDAAQAGAEDYARAHGLQGAEAEEFYDLQAQETLQTVNTYLGAVADVIKARRGVLDKYIGDCVMAFWGAPIGNASHAVQAVQAAIEAQQRIRQLNEDRSRENEDRERENPARAARGERPQLPLPLLDLGTGINSGEVIVGLMGSEAHISNYTVFGREVNLASRLEGQSGHGRIFIGEATYRDLERLAPELAAICAELPPLSLKGIEGGVVAYEVKWRDV